MHVVIDAPILKVFAQPASDLEMAVAAHGDVTEIKEAMDIGS